MHQLDRLPSEVLVKILGFTIGGDLNQLNKVKNTSPEWNRITDDFCFWREIFGESIVLKFSIEFILKF